MMIVKIILSDVTQSFMTMRRIEGERLGFETRLLLVEEEGEARFTLTDTAVPYVYV